MELCDVVRKAKKSAPWRKRSQFKDSLEVSQSERGHRKSFEFRDKSEIDGRNRKHILTKYLDIRELEDQHSSGQILRKESLLTATTLFSLLQ